MLAREERRKLTNSSRRELFRGAIPRLLDLLPKDLLHTYNFGPPRPTYICSSCQPHDDGEHTGPCLSITAAAIQQTSNPSPRATT
eukprot:scaffold112515_cov31-Attheya_sp.AAC.1